MGYKKVKEHYDIDHIVQERLHEKWGECILIGSPFISDLIVIRKCDAKIVEVYDRDYDDLKRYQDALSVDSENGKLLALINEPDNFEKSIPVYTYNHWAVEKHWCEELGWPNTTFTGRIMYEHAFFPTRAEAYKALKRNAGNLYSVKYPFRELKRQMAYLFEAIYKNSAQWLFSRTIARLYTRKIH